MKKAEGTYHFMPPECVSTEQNPNGFSGRAADIWAMGISFFAFTFYKVPFHGENPLELFENIEKQEYLSFLFLSLITFLDLNSPKIDLYPMN